MTSLSLALSAFKRKGMNEELKTFIRRIEDGITLKELLIQFVAHMESKNALEEKDYVSLMFYYDEIKSPVIDPEFWDYCKNGGENKPF